MLLGLANDSGKIFMNVREGTGIIVYSSKTSFVLYYVIYNHLPSGRVFNPHTVYNQ